MRVLADALGELSRHPRAVPWRIRLHARWANSGNVREHVVFAPPLGRSAWPVLARAHNAALLYNPAAVEIVAPLAAAELDSVLGPLRAVHNIPIVLSPDPVVPRISGDVPGVDEPPSQPAGEGVAVGLDIGGTGMKAVALDPASGALLSSAGAATWPPGEFGIASLIARSRALVVQVSEGRPIGSLGIGLATPMGVGGQVLELSTILRERVGDPGLFEGFAAAVGEGLVNGPVAIFNDLSNLGRHLSASGERRLVRLQIGTSFGGSWIDADGAAVSTEMGRLVVDVSPDAHAHPYLPIRGAMRSYLSNLAVARVLGAGLGKEVEPSRAGHEWKSALDERHPAGEAVVFHICDALVGVVRELNALLVGLDAVECGGSMLAGNVGRQIADNVGSRSPVRFRVSSRPGEDGAIAAALAPRVQAPLRGHLRVG